uniref:Putative ovule protein n=1 Tax=Solanum chacoense TaxID=4108 RepID=A0A0V0HNU3_SOLCH
MRGRCGRRSETENLASFALIYSAIVLSRLESLLFNSPTTKISFLLTVAPSTPFRSHFIFFLFDEPDLPMI